MSRHRLLGLSLALLGLAAIPGTSRGDFMIVSGNVPQTDENVLLDGGTSGNTIFGHTNATLTPVEITSAAQVLSSPSSGQARVEVLGGGDLLGIDSLTTPGCTYTSLIFNEFNQGSGGTTTTITVTGFDAFNNPETLTKTFRLKNGGNFFTITAINGEQITSVGFTTDGITDLRQIRIGGACPETAVPEPATIGMLSLGIGIVGFVGRRRRAAMASA